MALELTYDELVEAGRQLGDFVLASAPPQMRLAGLKAEEVLPHFKAEEVFPHFKAEERVAGLSLEERLVGLTQLTPEDKRQLAQLLAS